MHIDTHNNRTVSLTTTENPNMKHNKKFELMLTKRVKAYSSSGSR